MLALVVFGLAVTAAAVGRHRGGLYAEPDPLNAEQGFGQARLPWSQR